jgi:hypothetical protein
VNDGKVWSLSFIVFHVSALKVSGLESEKKLFTKHKEEFNLKNANYVSFRKVFAILRVKLSKSLTTEALHIFYSEKHSKYADNATKLPQKPVIMSRESGASGEAIFGENSIMH